MYPTDKLALWPLVLNYHFVQLDPNRSRSR